MAAYHHHHHRCVKEKEDDEEKEYQVAQEDDDDEEEDQHQMERPPSRQPQYPTPPPSQYQQEPYYNFNGNSTRQKKKKNFNGNNINRKASPSTHNNDTSPPPTTFPNQQYHLPNMERPPSERNQLQLPPNNCHEDYRSPSPNIPINHSPNQLQLCPSKPSHPPTGPNPAGYPQFQLPALGAHPDDNMQKPPSRHNHGVPISPNYININPNNYGHGHGLYPAGGNKNSCTSPPHHHHQHHGRRYPAVVSQLATAAAAIFLFLLGLVSLILYLIYRPSAPAFSLVSTSIFLLNTTRVPTSSSSSSSSSSSFNTPNMNMDNMNMNMNMMTITTTMQFTLLLHNPSRRASLSYDSLSATLLYRDTAQLLAPPSHLPPLHLGSRATVAATFVVGAGGNPVPLADEASQAMEDDVRYSGVLPLRLVVDAALRYKLMDGLVKIGPRGIRVTCDVILAAGLGSLKVHTITTSTGGGGGGGGGEGEGGEGGGGGEAEGGGGEAEEEAEGGGAYGGEVPLLSNPHCSTAHLNIVN